MPKAALPLRIYFLLQDTALLCMLAADYKHTLRFEILSQLTLHERVSLTCHGSTIPQNPIWISPAFCALPVVKPNLRKEKRTSKVASRHRPSFSLPRNPWHVFFLSALSLQYTRKDITKATHRPLKQINHFRKLRFAPT